MQRLTDAPTIYSGGSFHAGIQQAAGGANASGRTGVQQPAGGVNARLFETPPELLCPITQELLWDPVLTTSGQVYERAAIETHLVRAAAAGAPLTDPLTNTPLDSDQLLPVFPMRSRAAEYRESTVRSCVALAVSETRRSEAARYLRRAAELALPPLKAQQQLQQQQQQQGAGAGAPPAKRAGSGQGGQRLRDDADGADGELLVAAPGLSRELARFLVAHRGEAYHAVALKWFGNELMRGGFPDQAADVFYGLLLEEFDRQQQADYLALCLECWGHKSSGAAAAAGGKGDTAAAAVEAHAGILNKLADFVERQHCLSAGDIIDMLQAPTGVGRAGALRLCDVLLSRVVSGSDGGGGGGGGGGAGAVDASRRGSAAGGGAAPAAAARQQDLQRAVELLVRYVRLSCAEASDGAGRLAPQQERQQPAAVPEAVGARSSGDCGAAGKRGGGKLAGVLSQLRAVLSKGPARTAASCLFAVGSLAGGNGLALRAARLLPLLVLLHSSRSGHAR